MEQLKVESEKLKQKIISTNMEHAKELEMQISKVEREIKFSSADENIFKKILCDSIEFMLQDGLRNYNSHEQTGFGQGWCLLIFGSVVQIHKCILIKGHILMQPNMSPTRWD